MVITNIVITCNLTTTVFLPLMAKRYPWTEWNRKKFAALTLRFKSPKTTWRVPRGPPPRPRADARRSLVFASGRIVCTGANCMAAARLSVLQACRMVNDCGYPDARVKDFAVQNIASAYKFRAAELDLERLFAAYQAQTSYEPEASVARGALAAAPTHTLHALHQLFPALIFRPAPTGVVFLIFESGRVVITGSRSVAAAERERALVDDVLVNCYCKRRARAGIVNCSTPAQKT